MHPIRTSHRRPLPSLRPLAVLLGTACVPMYAFAETASPKVEVIGTSPVPGLEQARDEIPSNVQTVRKSALRDTGSGGMTELFASEVPSVSVNEIQGNPFQADVNYRGFTASPLLGTPQGLSVYQDGVRVNEPFGDVVNWDLIPRNAIASINLVPGSNPLFGLNTLGGALAIRTKNGFDDKGTGVEAYTGSFGRHAATFEHGGNDGSLGWYVTATRFREDGWRDASPSDVNQFFGKLSHRSSRHELDLNLTRVTSDLIGNGLTPRSFYQSNRDSIFTAPDNTKNHMFLLSANAGYWLDDTHKLSGTLYLRRNNVRTLNGDVNDEFAAPGDEEAVLNRTRTHQSGHGFSLQWAQIMDSHQYAAGTTYDRSSTRFRQTEQDAEFDAARSVTGDPAEDQELGVAIHGRTTTWSVFGTGTWRPIDRATLSLAGRYNHTRVQTSDLLHAVGDPESLHADYTYVKINPSLGATYALTPSLTLYTNLQQGNRAPSPVELGCSNPVVPCKLPNAMQSDPKLDQVVTRSFELGVRGKADAIRWNASAFTADNRDDILFVASNIIGQGYFKNFGKTRRSGIELGAGGDYGRFEWNASYSYVRATFQSADCIVAPDNSTEGIGGCGAEQIRIRSGDRIPNIPAQSFKLGLNWRATDWLELGSTVTTYSGVYVRGNENNKHDEDGKTSGFSVVNLVATAQLGKGWQMFARMNNVFDKRYFTAGQLAENPFTAAGQGFNTNTAGWREETFYAPGAPRAGWIGVRYRFGD